MYLQIGIIWVYTLCCFSLQFYYWLVPQAGNHHKQPIKRSLKQDLNTSKPASTRFRAKPQSVVNEVIKLSALMPHSGCRKIAMAFNAKHAQCNNMTVSHSYVAQQRLKHQHHIVQLRREIKHRIPRPQPNNRLWALDLITLADKHKHHHTVLGIIDHGSRANLALQRTQQKTSVALLRLLLNSIERYGKPRIIKTDNEACFTSRLFWFGLFLLGIKHQRSLPYCPWMNGRIERLFGTLRQCINHIVLDADQTQQRLNEFRLWYNHIRPHQHLYGNTPANVWNQQHYNQRGIAVEFSAWHGVLSGLYVPPD